jgi:hypothetical protein
LFLFKEANNMRRKLFAAIFIIIVLTVALLTPAQPPSGQGRGGMGTAAVTKRPDKAKRLESIAQLEKQIAILRDLIQKAPAIDPNVTDLKGEALVTYAGQLNDESKAVSQIVTILNALRPLAGSFTAEQVAELTELSRQDRAVKLTSRLEELARETVNQTPTRGGRGGTRGSAPPAGDFSF